MAQATALQPNALPGRVGGPYSANLPVYVPKLFVLVAIPQIVFELEAE
jgi:hypothetical protein